MQEIEVGDYVRTRGKIGKLIRIERDDIDISLKWYVLDDGKYERYVNKPYIEKYSKNIIDLIEVGDYVNGHLVVEISENIQIKPLVVTEVDGKDGAVRHFYAEKSIKSIVTHEQFASMQYRLED